MWQGLYFSWTHWTCFMTWEFSFNSLASKKKHTFYVISVLAYDEILNSDFIIEHGCVQFETKDSTRVSEKGNQLLRFQLLTSVWTAHNIWHAVSCWACLKKKDKNEPWHISTACFLKLSNLLNHLTCFPSRNLTYAALPNGFLLGWAVTAASLDG